ncbi:hypothetical protein GA0070606_5098 [Micromonospora citrea]|uniref:Uncharacterized protein n=1 Tax=Micromonospora citrea TaxID=47855 RepID=A0A1C6VT12_9ACTN|nr:hypothetical protein [Micromonospora citrea]SCL69489.1 hypothetical protein GA0070606_5098 [Micromonospora citrea]
MSTIDYVEQLTFPLFLKMADERAKRLSARLAGRRGATRGASALTTQPAGLLPGPARGHVRSTTTTGISRSVSFW